MSVADALLAYSLAALLLTLTHGLDTALILLNRRRWQKSLSSGPGYRYRLFYLGRNRCFRFRRVACGIGSRLTS
jgi:hypothetical protein